MNYYCLVAGLPNIQIDDSKLTYSVSDFLAYLDEQIADPADRQLLTLYRYTFDNQNLLALLQKGDDTVLDSRGSIAADHWIDLIQSIKSESPITQTTIPHFYVQFLLHYFEKAEDPIEVYAWDDFLAGLYYDYALQTKNQFARQWFAFNLDLNNVQTAIIAKRMGLELSQTIVGNTPVAEHLRTSIARDFGLSDLFAYFEEIARISEEQNLFDRERKIELIRWKWLEEQTLYEYFTMERVFSYLIQLSIIERWIGLNQHEGETCFRSIIAQLQSTVTIPKL